MIRLRKVRTIAENYERFEFTVTYFRNVYLFNNHFIYMYFLSILAPEYTISYNIT